MKSESTKTSRFAVNYIGRRIRECRQTGMMSQRQLADRAGMAQANLALIETGQANPTLETLTRIARALSMELAIDLRRKLGNY